MSRKAISLLALAFVLIYLAPLGLRPLFFPDETRYVEIPREMRATGDWTVPRLNGLLYFEKPVLGYWLNAISQELFGENRFAVRLPSALAVGLSALSIFLLVGRRREEDSAVAGFAGALFFICPLVFFLGTYVILDGPFSAFFTLAMACFFRGNMEASTKKKRGFYAAFGVASGLAFLTKGFLGLTLPVIVIVPYMLWRRQWRELMRFPWVPLLLAVAVALPWALAIHSRAPDFWRYFVWHEHLQRFFDPAAGFQHSEPIWYFVPVLLGGAFPLLFLLPAAIAGLRRSWKEPLVVFCLLWLGMVFAFFSASKGKLGTYILPCFPPVAILVALGTQRYLQSGQTRLFANGAKAMGGLVLVLLLGFTALHALPFPAGWRLFSQQETGRWLVGSAGLLVWGILALRASGGMTPFRKVMLFTAAPAVFLAVFYVSLPDLTIKRKTPMALLDRNAARVHPDSLLMTTSHLVSALNWQFHRTDVIFANSGGELTYGMNRAPEDSRIVLDEEIVSFVAAHSGEGNLILFLTDSSYARYSPELPDPLYLDRLSRFVFAQF